MSEHAIMKPIGHVADGITETGPNRGKSDADPSFDNGSLLLNSKKEWDNIKV